MVKIEVKNFELIELFNLGRDFALKENKGIVIVVGFFNGAFKDEETHAIQLLNFKWNDSIDVVGLCDSTECN